MLKIIPMKAKNMKIGDLGKATGTQVEAIRYYEREGLLPSPARTEANYRVFEQESRGKLELTKRFLNTIAFHEDGKICSGELTQADYVATGTSKEDKEGLVEFPRSVEGVEIAVLMEEGADGIRGSLRGRDPKLRLDLCAGKLNGGGHMLAAGFNMQGCRLRRAHVEEDIHTVLPFRGGQWTSCGHLRKR